jgi:tetratricopeptide (TPR) repeat protein
LILFQTVWAVPRLLGGAAAPDLFQLLVERNPLWTGWAAVFPLAAALAIPWILARGRRGVPLGSVFLAASPLWLAALFEPGGAATAALAVALLVGRDHPALLRGLGLGCLVATHPLGLPAAAGALALVAVSPTGERRGHWAASLALAVPVAALWNPQLLMDWPSAAEALLWRLRLLGFLGPMPEPYIRPDAIGSLLFRNLGPATPLLALAGIFGIGARRDPAFLFALLFAASLLLGGTWGRLDRETAAALAPWLAFLAGEGGAVGWDRIRSWLQPLAVRPVAWILIVLVLAPLGARTVREASSWFRPSAERAAAAWLADHVGEGEWVVLDPEAPAAPGWSAGEVPGAQPTPERVLRIPRHRLRPDLYRGSYWLGWYLPFDYLVLCARTAAPLLDTGAAYADILDFYTGALVRLEEKAVFGGPGWRDPKISILGLPGDSLEAHWPDRLAAGPDNGLQPEFLLSLGSALAGAGRPAEALAVLSRAGELGDRSKSLFNHLGALHLERKTYDEAARVLEEGLHRWPRDPGLLHNLALVYSRAGLHGRAVPLYERLLDAAPWNHEASLHLAASLMLSGREDRAQRVIEDYIRRVAPDERSPEARRLLEDLGVEGSD